MNDWEKLNEIHRLLDEAYRNYFEKSHDGHHKSSEAAIEVSFGNYWERDERVERGLPPLGIHSISVYSYVLGPNRMHYFRSVDEALVAVRGWHKAEMERDYTQDAWAGL